jgi:hypothetical protein
MSDAGDDKDLSEDGDVDDSEQQISSSLSDAAGEKDLAYWRAACERQRRKWQQATVTIQSLIEQFTEYKETVEEEKQTLEEKVVTMKTLLAAEQAKSMRVNQETIANLQTLMAELELIESKNQECGVGLFRLYLHATICALTRNVCRLNEELMQERTDHERSIVQVADLRAANADLEDDIKELKLELEKRELAMKTAAATADVAKRDLETMLSTRSGGSRVSARPSVRPGATDSRPSINRFRHTCNARDACRFVICLVVVRCEITTAHCALVRAVLAVARLN